MSEEEKKTEKKEKEKYQIGEVATQTAPVLIDTETKDTLTEMEILAKILNNQAKIMKSVS